MFQTSDHSHLEIGIIIFDTVLVFIIIAIVTDMRKAQKFQPKKIALKWRILHTLEFTPKQHKLEITMYYLFIYPTQ